MKQMFLVWLAIITTASMIEIIKYTEIQQGFEKLEERVTILEELARSK